MENHHFQWVIPLFLWPCSIAMLVYQRVLKILGISACIERCLQDMSTLSSNARDEIPKDSPHQMDKALRLKMVAMDPKDCYSIKLFKCPIRKGDVFLFIFGYLSLLLAYMD